LIGTNQVGKIVWKWSETGRPCFFQRLKEHIFTLHESGLYRRMQVGESPEEIEKWKTERRK
jgi:hypothetical protein